MVASLVFLIVVMLVNFPVSTAFEQDVRVGAYYYIWWSLPFNNHWNECTKGTPFLGEYNSSNPEVADKHITLAKQHKISFFAVSWLGTFNWSDHCYIDEQNLKNGFLKAERLSEFNFCLYYESKIILDSVYDMYVKRNYSDHGYPNPADFFKNVFINDTKYAAEHYFNHPSYLHVDGKPVFFIHNLPNLYQNLTDIKVKELLDEVRLQLLQNYGEEVYFIGDMGSESNPQKINVDWTYSMNGITHYLFSDPAKGWCSVLNDTRYYQEWCEFANTIGVKFIPNVYPGFNNTSCEGVTNPTALPTNETAFREMLTIAKNFVDNNLKIIMITSWNEWLEGTAIEPSMELGELFLHTVYDIIPEFPALFVLPLFIVSTLVVVIFCKRKHVDEDKGRFLSKQRKE